MAFKLVTLAALLAVANAGYLAAPAAYAAPALHTAYAAPALVSTAVGSSQQATLRSLDGGSVVSQYSKAVDTAFSSVRKFDTRVTNDARYVAPAVVAHAAPAVVAHAAPAVVAHAAPAVVAHAAPAAGLLGVAYSAAPAVAHYSFDGFGAHLAW